MVHVGTHEPASHTYHSYHSINAHVYNHGISHHHTRQDSTSYPSGHDLPIVLDLLEHL